MVIIPLNFARCTLPTHRNRQVKSSLNCSLKLKLAEQQFYSLVPIGTLSKLTRRPRGGGQLFKRTQGQVNSVGPWHQSLLNWIEIWMWSPPLGRRVSLLKALNFHHDNDQFWVRTKRLVWRMTAQPHNCFVFCVVVLEFAVNGNQA